MIYLYNMDYKHTATNVVYSVVRKGCLGSTNRWVLESKVDGSRKVVDWSKHSGEYEAVSE